MKWQIERQIDCEIKFWVECQMQRQVEYQIKRWSMCEFKRQNSFRTNVQTISVVGNPSKKVLF